ncbi:hypothetical protein MRX96_018084 [Rhipicephalus microplus]
MSFKKKHRKRIRRRHSSGKDCSRLSQFLRSLRAHHTPRDLDCLYCTVGTLRRSLMESAGTRTRGYRPQVLPGSMLAELRSVLRHRRAQLAAQTRSSLLRQLQPSGGSIQSY